MIHRDPPRATERLLRAALGSTVYADDILGDLREAYVELQARRSPAYARWWYRVQALRLSSRYVWRRRGHGSQGHHHVGQVAFQLRLAVRALSQRLWMSAAVVLTLAVGIGANTAVFGMIEALVLHPYSVPDVDRVVMPIETAPDSHDRKNTVAPANFLDWRRDLAGTIDHLSAFQWWDATLAGRDEPERVLGFHVSAGFFSALGVPPILGRGFRVDEETRGRNAVVVLSDGLWKRRFGGDPSVVGRSIRLDGGSSIVIGIAPPGFGFPMMADLWGPLAFDPDQAPSRTIRTLTVIGRLAPAVTLREAAARVAVEGDRLASDFPDDNARRGARLYTLSAGMTQVGLGAFLWLWQAAAVFVLLIACVNVANLLLARGAERGREMAVRLALGCSCGRLVAESLLESGLLVALAAPLSIGVAWAFLDLLRGFLPPRLVRFVPGWTTMTIDGRLIAMTLGIAALTAVVFGLVPALHLEKGGVMDALTSDARAGSSPGRQRMRRALVVAEVALVLPLLVAALLGTRSVQMFLTGWQGYDPNGVLTLRVSLQPTAYPDAARRRQFIARMIDDLSALPGVTRAVAANLLPASDSEASVRVEVDGATPPADSKNRPSVDYRSISDAYFDALRIPLRAGRAFTRADGADAAPVVIVSESFVRMYFPPGEPVGRRMRIVGKPWMTVVGVCGDLVHGWADGRNTPTLYRPLAQGPEMDLMFAVRASVTPSTLMPSVRRAFAEVDDTQPIYDVMPMSQMLEESTIGLQFAAGVMGVFASVALLLAILGLYAVMTYLVTQRIHEIGVRIALGASPRDMLQLALGQAARLTAAGVAIGLGLSLLLNRAIEAGLVGVVRTDVKSTLALAAMLSMAGIASSYLPARRAANVDPIVALRKD